MKYEVIQGNSSNVFRFRVKQLGGTYRSFTINDTVRIVIKKTISSTEKLIDELMLISNDGKAFVYELSPTQTNLPIGIYVILFQWENPLDFDQPKVLEIQGNTISILEQGI